MHNEMRNEKNEVNELINEMIFWVHNPISQLQSTDTLSAPKINN